MMLHDAATETLFGNRIDGQFPYHQPDLAAALIRESRSISVNAVFYVLNELCRPPFPGTVTQERQRALVEEWAADFDHPLKDQMLRCADQLISERPLTRSEAVSIIAEVGKFAGQRAALCIAYSAGDCTSEDDDAALNDAELEVRRSWEQMGV